MYTSCGFGALVLRSAVLCFVQFDIASRAFGQATVVAFQEYGIA